MGRRDKFTETRDQLKEILLATTIIVTLGLAMTAYELFKAFAGKSKNSYKDFILMGIGSVIWLIYLLKLWLMIKNMAYNDVKNVRK